METSVGLAAAVVVVVVAVALAAMVVAAMLLAGGGVLLARRSRAPRDERPVRHRTGNAPTAVPESGPSLRKTSPAGHARSLSGFPSLPPSGRHAPSAEGPLAPPQVPGAIRSVTPHQPPPPTRRNNGMLGFFDEPPSEPGDAAKTELFQRGKVETGWDDNAGDTAEATEIFSALTTEVGDEGFADDTSSSRTRKR